MLGNGPDDFHSVDETFVLEKFNYQPFFVVVEKRFLAVILTDNVRSGRKLQRLARVNLQISQGFIMFLNSKMTFVITNVIPNLYLRQMCVYVILEGREGEVGLSFN